MLAVRKVRGVLSPTQYAAPGRYVSPMLPLCCNLLYSSLIYFRRAVAFSHLHPHVDRCETTVPAFLETTINRMSGVVFALVEQQSYIIRSAVGVFVGRPVGLWGLERCFALLCFAVLFVVAWFALPCCVVCRVFGCFGRVFFREGYALAGLDAFVVGFVCGWDGAWLRCASLVSLTSFLTNKNKWHQSIVRRKPNNCI